MTGIRQALADPLQPPECVLGDIAGVDDPHHIAVIQDRRFLDMMIGKHVADSSQIVRQVYRDDGFAGDVPDFAVHQLLQFFVKIHGHERRRIDVERVLSGEKPQDISVGNKPDQRPVAIDHGNAADAFFRQQIQHGGQAGVTADCVDVLFHKLRQGRGLCRRSRGSLRMDVERAPQQDDLQQHQPHVKEDGGFAHFDAPHAGHGVRDRADRRHAQVGFNGHGDPQRHDEEPRHVHQESHKNTGFFRFLLHFYASLF